MSNHLFKSSIALFSLLLALAGCGDTINNTMAGYVAPGVPSNVQATFADSQATITWSPASNAVSYNIYWKLSSGVTTTDNAILNASSPYVHQGLTNGQTYYYVVTGVNVDSEGEVSSEASATPAASTAIPSAPASMQATAGDKQATILWDPVAGATFYNIYWSTAAGVTASSNKVYNAPSPYVHAGLTNDTTYYYSVSAVNSAGESSLSPEASAAPVSASTAPAAPVNAQLAPGDGKLTLSWDPVANATSYNIYWSLHSGVSTASNKITSAEFPYAHMGLTNNNTYYYRVSAVNSAGESALSTETSAQPRALFSAENKLISSPTETSAYFGESVSISGDYAVIGAYAKDEKGEANAGAAYIFHRTGPDTWDAGTKLTASDPEAYAYFGNSVSISGDYAVIGAYAKDEGGNAGAGAAYIFHRSGPNTWDAGAKLTASDPEVSALFGYSVSISGDYAVVGSNWKDEGGNANAGAAYIFHRTGPNTWDSGTKLTASDPEASAYFGESVSLSGDYAIVGAYGKDEGGNAGTGAAYIFHRTGPNTWDAGTKLTASDLEASAYFGNSVSISGDYAVMGAKGKNEGGNTDAGAVYVFHRTDTNTWGSGAKLTASDLEADARFGASVSISGDYAIVGAEGKNEVGSADAGAAYIY